MMMPGQIGKSCASGVSALAILFGAAAAAPAVAAETTRITLLYPIAVGGPLEAVINGLVADFEAKNPTIDVDAVYAGGYRDVEVAARAAVEGGDAPAVALMEAVNLFALIDEGIITPFDDLASSPEDKAWLDGFYPAFMTNSRDADGKTWSIPFQRSSAIQYWNKDQFRKAGLDPEKGPETWDELVEMAAVLQAKGGAEWGIGIPSQSPWIYQSLALQNGVHLSSPDGKKANFADPGAIEALQWLADLSLVKKVQAPGIINYGSLPQAFFEGKFGIVWTTTGALTQILKGASFPVGVGMLPANKTRGAAAGGANLFILSAATDEEKRAGFELVKFLTEPEQAAKWTIATGYVAPTPAAWETKALQDLVAQSRAYAVARDQLPYTDLSFATFQQGRVYGLLTTALGEVVTGQKTAKEALTRIQGEADSILAPYQ